MQPRRAPGAFFLGNYYKISLINRMHKFDLPEPETTNLKLCQSFLRPTLARSSTKLLITSALSRSCLLSFASRSGSSQSYPVDFEQACELPLLPRVLLSKSLSCVHEYRIPQSSMLVQKVGKSASSIINRSSMVQLLRALSSNTSTQNLMYWCCLAPSFGSMADSFIR